MMNKHHKPDSPAQQSDLTPIQFMLRAQQIAKQDARSDKGYAMMMTSIVSILMFSMLGAYLTMSNMSSSSTNAYVDGTNTFYTAESGLNARAEKLRKKIIEHVNPSGLSPGQPTTTVTVYPKNISNCFYATQTTLQSGSNDFSCQNYTFSYTSNSGTVQSANGTSSITDVQKDISYTAYTFVAERTNYNTSISPLAPFPVTIPTGQTFAGLQAQKYQYTIYSTAAKPDAANNTVRQNDAKTVLEMNFNVLNIPLFQFAVFYDEDLEMNSSSQMDIFGRVHTNGNFYLEPTNGASTTFFADITAAGKIYNGVDSSTAGGGGSAFMNIGGTNTLITPQNNGSSTTALIPPLASPNQSKITSGDTGAVGLQPPEPSFLRKQDSGGNISDYYGKADIRLEMVPNRTAAPFNFTTFQTNFSGNVGTTTGASGGTCSTAFNYMQTDREGYASIKCNVFKEGQLRSLQQPVLVMPTTGAEALRFCNITGFTPPSAIDKQRLQALALAVSADPQILSVTTLKTNIGTTSTLSTNLPILLGTTSIATAYTTGAGTSATTSPDAFARSRNSCFLPAPIQFINTTTSTAGYYDRREKNNDGTTGISTNSRGKWLTMLQSNIESLTVWNRDGLFVTLNENLTDRENVTSTNLTNAYNTVTTSATAPANNLVFERAAAISSISGSFQQLGLAATDRTEAGLVFYATVSDDLDGNGTTSSTVDVSYDTTSPIKNKLGQTIAYKRKYPSTTGVSNSPYAFAFNGGVNLPGPLTLASDQGIYVQGDYNFCMANCQNTTTSYNTANNTAPSTSFVKTPASILADTITVLSNACQSVDDERLNCGVQATTVSTTSIRAATSTRMNAAFLSYTDRSCGNLNPTTPSPPISPSTSCTTSYSGGLNNYMRMSENWGGAGGSTFVYRGSFISMGSANEFSGTYYSGGSGNSTCTSGCTGNSYYNIPIRDFGFDTDFLSFQNLPPLTPMGTYLQQEIFKRNYNN